MKIIVFSQYYEPEPFLIHDKMKRLVELGHDVTVITGLPNYPKGELIFGYKTGNSEIDGVKIVRLPIRPRKKGIKNLFLNYLSYAMKASKYVRKLEDSYDAIFVYQLSPVFMAIPAVVLKKRINKPIVLYCLDLWPESLVSGGVKKGSLIYNIVKLISKKIYKAIDRIEISSKSFEKYFKQTLKIQGDYVYNPQYAVDENSDYVDTDIDFSEDKINISFTGNIGEMQGLEVAIKAMKNVDDKVVLHIIGDGSKKEALESLANELNIKSKIKFHGRKPVEQMKSVMENSDALLVTMKNDEVISYTLPAKVQSYLKSGKFIIGSINGEAADVIKESKAGIVSPAEDEIKLAENINLFVNNYDEFKKSGFRGTEYYNNNFGKDKFIQILLNDLKDITSK
ncbi:glycosyltransferase family 4 protein [Macrococcoides caseolyticum]|uniref:Glycosyltransferase WbuB n=1 Tax=Macrococcoides caseolyticum TaxID=69966 RepID=A0A855GZ26_9STAP|nr:glycosyltransferase family 4 protein [Macrococcus caseolyticus]PKE12569.1 glycosyltransferase WbuB [Macrococcus caseolyticus]PKE26393.1 glycosyltransferase WbuB [Macrococcus caseolyticus]PKE48966.1 glycosyltransferase WbuB [Macrococcus caseolyticus]PKE58907.1 glycosyltransferase WbuB [Macrococcus caseolyticus]PKE69873.1 glycosyltransferase WbuB [Macrococcus caseolyticus]